MAFSKVRARLGAARLVLAETPEEMSRKTHSQLQRRAVENILLSEDGRKLEDQEKANLAAMLSKVKFAHDDEMRLLSILSTDVDTDSKRRPQQVFLAFVNYLGSDDWEYSMEANCEAIVEKLVEILVTRFGCINPCNYTTKRIACVGMAIDKKNRTEAAMNTILKSARTAYGKVKRRYNKLIKTDRRLQIPYVDKLPQSPSEFEKLHPELIGRFKPPSGWVQPSIDVERLAGLEAKIGCRNGNKEAFDREIVPFESPEMSNNPLAMCMQLLRESFQGCRREGEVSLSFPQTRKKRSLREIVNEHADDSQNMRRAKTVHEWDGIDDGIDDGLSAAKPPTEKSDSSASPEKPETSATVAAKNTLSIKDDPACSTIAIKDEKSNVGVLLDALLEREKEKALEAKAKKAAEAAAAKEKKAIEKADAAATKAPLKAAGPPTTGSPPKAASSSKKKKEGVEHEATRNHYLARTCKNGSKKFKYGAGYTYSTPAKAKAEAEKWFNENR